MDFKLKQIALDDIDRVELNEETQGYYGGSDGFWYDITDGGYFRIKDVIDDSKQINEIQNAIDLLRDLESLYEQLVPEM